MQIDLTADNKTTTPEIPPQAMPLAKSDPLMMGDRIPDFGDIILPRLNIVQNLGGLKDSYPSGAIVFGSTEKISLFTPPIIEKSTGKIIRPSDPPVQITILGFRPDRFVEKIEGGNKGRMAFSPEEVTAMGGTLDYKEWKLKESEGMTLFQPMAEALIAIRRPEHVNDGGTVFTFPVEGREYALGLWAMKGTAYTYGAKRVFFPARRIGPLRIGGYPSMSFYLTTRMESFGGSNTAWIPVAVPAERSSEAFLAFAQNILMPPEQPE